MLFIETSFGSIKVRSLIITENDNIIDIERPRLVPYQKAILETPARFSVTTASTKIGKTFSHLWWLFEQSAEPPKPGANYWWVAPVFGQCEIAFNRLRRFLGHSSDFRINLTKLLVETPVESIIQFKSAQDPDGLYGEDVYAAVFDEFTRAKEAAWIALRSTLTATKGKCKFIGNAKGKKNWGSKLAAKARLGDPAYAFFKITAYDAIREGILAAEEVEQARRDLPKHAFDELYLAEELEDQANPFGISFIKDCVKPMSTLPPVAFGIDLAKSIDYTVVLGIDKNGDVCSLNRWQADWPQTKRRIVEIVGQTPGYIDSTGVGDPIADDVILKCRSVEKFTFTSHSKQQIMEGLAVAIQQRKTSVLAGVHQDELESFEFVYSKAGVKYSAPEGLHDDIVCAHALAVHRQSKPTLKLRVI